MRVTQTLSISKVGLRGADRSCNRHFHLVSTLLSRTGLTPIYSPSPEASGRLKKMGRGELVLLQLEV